MTIKELIEQLEQATGPSMELDAMVGAAMHRGPNADEVAEAFEDRVEVYRKGQRINKYIPARFTSSIDSALTLVPEGMCWTIGTVERKFTGISGYWAIVHKPAGREIVDEGTYSSPAIALVIASLKARLTS